MSKPVVSVKWVPPPPPKRGAGSGGSWSVYSS